MHENAMHVLALNFPGANLTETYFLVYNCKSLSEDFPTAMADYWFCLFFINQLALLNVPTSSC
jgi:hypothetical protein